MSTQITELAVRPLTPTAQLGPALALVALLQEHPGLPSASWDINQHTGDLRGTLGRTSFDALRAYADVLGGEIAPEGRDFESPVDGVRLRSHRLRVVWRDVRIVVSLHRPAPVAKAVAA